MRGPLSVGGSGIPDVQFELDDAFVTSATLDVDAGSSAAGTVDLVLAANGFHKVTPTNPPPCDCSSGVFLAGAGTPAFSAIGVGVSTGTSPSVSTTRTYQASWSDSVAGSAVDRRDGRVDLFNASLSQTVAQIDLANLDPAFPFTPMFVDGRQH